MQISAVSRNAVAVAVTVIGLVAIGLAFFGSPGLSGEPDTRSFSHKPAAIEPVKPVDTEDLGPSSEEADTKPSEDFTNPFSTSIGGNFAHKVAIEVSADGVVQVAVNYRDGKQQEQLAVNSTFSTKRTVRGGYPLSMVTVTIPRKYPGRATRATCTISVDGRKVDSDTIKRVRSVARCVG